MKILVLNNLSIISLPIIIFFRLLNFKILFISINSYFRNRNFLKFLSLFNINWFNYQEYKLDDVKIELMVKAAKFSENLSSEISDKYWHPTLEKIFINKFYLTACLTTYIYKYEIQNVMELMTIAKSFEKNGNKTYLWIPNNLISKRVNAQFYNLKNLNIFPNFYIMQILIIGLNVIKRKLKNLNSKKNNKLSNNTKSAKKYNNFKIAHYPHKGIYYLSDAGDYGKPQLYLKDYFYSYNKNDPFFYQNLLHIEWNLAEVDQKSKNYYDDNNIQYLEWRSFSDNWKILIKTFLFWKKNMHLFFKLAKYDFQILYYLLFITFQIFKSLENLSKLENLKVLLCCHDELFPTELSVACKIKKIMTVSIQDRISVSNVIPLFIFDLYFASGEKSKNIIRKKMPDPFVKNLKNLYLIKTDKYHDLKNDKNYNNDYLNYKFKCIVMDWHSFPGWYENGRAIVQNWRINKDFYQIIIDLANNYPQVNFLIKSKNYKWMNISFFEKIVNDMNKKKNISILDDQKKWMPMESLKVGDFAIARPSSLAEEMLFIGKPVIIYNSCGGIPEKVFDFGKKILANNYEEISEKLNLIIKDYGKFNSELDEDRNKLFYKREPGKLNREMNKIFMENKPIQ